MEKDTEEKNIIELHPAFETARLRAIDFSKRTGREYGVLMDSKKIVAEQEGTEKNVDFAPYIHLLEDNWLVHTHPEPNGSSLSVEDILVMEANGMAGVTALTEDGSIYTAQSTGRLRPSMVGQVRAFQQIAMGRAGYLYMEGGYGRQATTLALSHQMNLFLDREGLVRYTYRLSDKVEKVWEAMKDIV